MHRYRLKFHPAQASYLIDFLEIVALDEVSLLLMSPDCMGVAIRRHPLSIPEPNKSPHRCKGRIYRLRTIPGS
jgi:hypothetical protein